MAILNKTVNQSIESEHVLSDILIDHQLALSTICMLSVMMGLPLNMNMLWHLQVANNSTGRGVLRLIRLHTLINILCVPMICADLIILAYPSEKMPLFMCVCIDWVTMFIWANGSFKGLMIALARWVWHSCLFFLSICDTGHFKAVLPTPRVFNCLDEGRKHLTNSLLAKPNYGNRVLNNLHDWKCSAW